MVRHIIEPDLSGATEKTTPVSADTLLIADSAASNAPKRVQIGNLPGGGSFDPHYFFVAADNATAREKAVADYQCDGTADEVQINLAITAVRTTGGQVILSSGAFAIAASVDMTGETAESGDNPQVRLIGNGIDSTFLNGASDIDVIETGQRAKYEIAYLSITVAGSGDGIHQTAGDERGNWQSHVHDIFIKSNFTDHTGWGIDMQSPFRMRFTNIEMNGVANGCNLQCHTNAFNPGNISIDRMFIDLWNDASNPNAIGFKLAVLDADATGVMNLVTVNRLDIYGGNNLTGSVGISIVGSSTSYGDSRQHTFTNLNIEDVKTVIKHVRGRDCTYNDVNYSRVLSGGTFFSCDSESNNNHFENAFLATGGAHTVTVISDANTSTLAPNSFTRLTGWFTSGSTLSASVTPATLMSRLNLGGGSPTIAAALRPQSLEYKYTTEASSATPTITGDAVKNHYTATAQAADCTLAAPSGTAHPNATLLYRITASGATRTVGYNAGLLAGNVTRTTSVPATETLIQGYVRVGSTWVCVFNDLV